MKPNTLERREQIRRDYEELQEKGWKKGDIFEELARRYYLSPETVRQNVYHLGSYADHSKPYRLLKSN
jgi:tRNA A58 N-methylase Trm61